MSVEGIRAFFDQAVAIWLSGGWGMVALAFDGLVMHALGMFILMKLWIKGVHASPERAWRRWKMRPGKPRGTVGHIIAEAMGCHSMKQMEHYFDGLHNAELYPFERDLRVMKVSVNAAPLLGLLGTVTGMLATFRALATGGGGEKTMGMVASGISEALVTTETGLVLALTGLIFQFMLTRQHNRYGRLMAHLQTLCTQELRRLTIAGRTGPPLPAMQPGSDT
jgi:biopolymer transport protein ExbB